MHRIMVLYGHQAETMAIRMMEAMNISEEIRKLGKENPYIALKPNLVVAQPAHWGATTSPELVRGVIRYLKGHGFSNIAIMESSWIGDRTDEAFRICGYETISQQFDVPLIDLKKDTYKEIQVEELTIKVCREPLKADYLINLPVLKAHCQTKITCALKNLKGCIPDQEKRRFHRLGLHQPIASLSKALRAHLTIVDGLIGDLTHEEGGNPVRMGLMLAGRDPVLIDAYVAELLGYEAKEIPYIGLAARLGVGADQVHEDLIVELNQNVQDTSTAPIEPGEEVDYLRQWIKEDRACSPCFGALVYALMRLKEKGRLKRLPKGIAIGQGYQRQKGPGMGIGSCTSGLDAYLPGCPPKARDIILFLQDYLSGE